MERLIDVMLRPSQELSDGHDHDVQWRKEIKQEITNRLNTDTKIPIGLVTKRNDLCNDIDRMAR